MKTNKKYLIEMLQKVFKIFIFVVVGIFGFVLGFIAPYNILMDSVIALMIFNIFLMRR